jgi:hypothetical protein
MGVGETEKFAISLFEDQDGTKSLYYLAFRPNAEAYQDMMKAMIQNPSDCGSTKNEQIGTAKRQPDFTGFWKTRCSNAFGVQIKKQTGNLFSVSFCGPGGCFDPGAWIPNTPIAGDPQYHIYDPTTIAIQHGNGWQTYTKCTTDTNPKLDYSTMRVEKPSEKQGTPTPKKP